MRILFDSKQTIYKDPFGTLTPLQPCTLHLHIPTSVQAQRVLCVMCREDGTPAYRFEMPFLETKGAYAIHRCVFQLPECGLFFYYFEIFQQDNSFKLYKQGDDTNMEQGDCWQLSCIPADFTTPDWAKGAIIYQIYPDRFYRAGQCDLTGKLEPYSIHSHWDEEVEWKPTPEGLVLNNDFFGGNFQGIIEKMDYIASLGTTILYLNPISKSFSNHRYDTGDYKTPDPMLGTLADFAALCQAAHDRGIHVVLDGVYSHTGANSLYFDKEGYFGGQGAYCNPDSPYRSWYTFHEYPHSYVSWWDFDTLPTVNKMDPSFLEYMIFAENSVVAHWLNLGADGFRLDVVDELPNEFVYLLKQRIRQIKPDALLMGEIWEDASNKIAYGIRRRYFVDGVLDSCMNYPLRTALLNFLRGVDSGEGFRQVVMALAENYPPQVLLCNMNLLGSHDTPRILTALVDDFDGSREVLAQRHLTPYQKERARQLLLMAAFLQYTLPGSPSIYYADEAGMEGHKDPFNRRTYPWGREDRTLLEFFRSLGQLRKTHTALQLGTLSFFHAGGQKLGFTRTYQNHRLRVYVNRSETNWEIPADTVLLGHNQRMIAPNWLSLASMGFCITEAQ